MFTLRNKNIGYTVYYYIIIVFFLQLTKSSSNSQKMANNKICACDFEVFGRVQGVFFRKYTQSKAQELGLRGWCMNTYHETVKGQMEGSMDKINEMKEWLRNTGSPQSRIDKAQFSEVKEIPEYTFDSFSIKR